MIKEPEGVSSGSFKNKRFSAVFGTLTVLKQTEE